MTCHFLVPWHSLLVPLCSVLSFSLLICLFVAPYASLSFCLCLCVIPFLGLFIRRSKYFPSLHVSLCLTLYVVPLRGTFYPQLFCSTLLPACLYRPDSTCTTFHSMGDHTCAIQYAQLVFKCVTLLYTTCATC